MYVGSENAKTAPNGGTVIAGKHDTRWVLQHDGTVDFRVFGITGPEKPADDALAAMVNDPRIRRIEAGTDLLFRRRHARVRGQREREDRAQRRHRDRGEARHPLGPAA
ncbi:hypothetical protein CTI14_56140 [Methylobacterium radiotolerans]|nr:hypothetical protein CTI14_56140 [Methylobacterium radiotolerans]